MSQELMNWARHCHARLPAPVRQYLNGCGIPDTVIDRFLIGWNGWRVTVPIYDRTGDVYSFTLLSDPPHNGDGPLTFTVPNSGAELYGWEHVVHPVPGVIISDDVFARLLLEGRGFAAVASTRSGTFRRAWMSALAAVPRVYLCFGRSRHGRVVTARIGCGLPHAKVVTLPPSVGEGGVADFFLRLGSTAAAFEALLRAAGRSGRRRIATQWRRRGWPRSAALLR